MSTHKNFDKICVAVLAFTLLITVLFMNGSRLGIELVVDEDSEGHSGSKMFTKSDLDASWDSSGATVISLKGSTASVSGSGAYVKGSDVIIASAGTFKVSGTLDDGSLIVNAHKNSKVWILLDGADISCSDDACFRVDQADKVFLTLAEGSVNSMKSGASYSQTALSDGTGGAVFAHDDLTVNGSGSLSVTAGYKHGIDANDDLVIAGGVISISAVQDGIRANDSLRLANAELSIAAGDDGLTVSSEEGFFYIESGSLAINCGGDGVNSAGDVTVAGGSINISAGDDGIHSDTNIAVTGCDMLISKCYEGLEAITIDISGGNLEIYPADDGLNANGGSGFGMIWSKSSSDSEAADTRVRISGGSLTIVNETAIDADGIDSNGDIIISGGTVRISLVNSGSNNAIDYGSESGASCVISGGTVIACGSYSMAEGFGPDSSQCSVLYNLSGGEEGGKAVTLRDSGGNDLLSWEVPCSFSSVVLSCPGMELGETYTVIIGENAEEISLDEVSASFGDAQSTLFGGNMNWGGMKPYGFSESGDGSSDRPARPGSDNADGGSNRPERPSDGQMPELPESIAMPGQKDYGGDAEDVVDTDTRSPLDSVSWEWIAASAAVLAAAIFAAAVFRRR